MLLCVFAKIIEQVLFSFKNLGLEREILLKYIKDIFSKSTKFGTTMDFHKDSEFQ
jgi:hypothetical protein